MNDEDVPTGEMTSQSGQDPPEDKCNQHGWCNLLHQLFGFVFTSSGGSLFSFAFCYCIDYFLTVVFIQMSINILNGLGFITDSFCCFLQCQIRI